MRTQSDPELRSAARHDCLSWGDSLFLHLEREGQPLSIASFSDFEGEIDLKACRQFVESRLPLIPRYRQRVVSPPLNVGLPTWEFDPHFDIRNHISEVTLKRGTEAEFKTTAAKLVSATLDRQRPLWHFTLVHGLKGHRTGIVARVHHCLADGIAGVELMSVLMDANAKVAPPPKRAEVRSEPPRDAMTLFVDGLLRSCFSVVDRVLKVQAECATAVQGAMRTSEGGDVASYAQATESVLPGMIELITEMAAPTERLPFNSVCRGPQQTAWAEIPLDEIKAIKNACGATVNDVILAVLTIAIGRYCELHGFDVTGRNVRIVVPVNVRSNGQVTELGNQITFLPLNVPLDLRDPGRLMSLLHRKMESFKTSKAAELVVLAGTLAGTIPPSLQAIVAPIVSQLPLSLANTIITNVPGPQHPLYFMGHKMLRWYPYVPIGGEMGVNIAALSYNGFVYFGFTGDVHAAPDLARFEKLTGDAFDELRRQGNVKPRAKANKKAPTRVRKIAKPASKVAIAAKPATQTAHVAPPLQIEPEKEVALAAGVS